MTRCQETWIPACAGMTVLRDGLGSHDNTIWPFVLPLFETTDMRRNLDPGLRRDDSIEGWAWSARH